MSQHRGPPPSTAHRSLAQCESGHLRISIAPSAACAALTGLRSLTTRRLTPHRTVTGFPRYFRSHAHTVFTTAEAQMDHCRNVRSSGRTRRRRENTLVHGTSPCTTEDRLPFTIPDLLLCTLILEPPKIHTTTGQVAVASGQTCSHQQLHHCQPNRST